MWDIIRRPLIAIALAVAPLWLFFGMSNTLIVNGELVQSSRFNILGVIMAIIALRLAWTSVSAFTRPEAVRTDIRRQMLAGIAGLLAVLQLAYSADLIRWPFP